MTRNYWLIILISAGLAVTGCSSLINSPSGSEYPAIWLADGFDFPVGGSQRTRLGRYGIRLFGLEYCQQLLPSGRGLEYSRRRKRRLGRTGLCGGQRRSHFSGWNSALGNVILIKHNLSRSEAVWSQYAHLDRRDVRTGEKVTRNQQIGTVGRGGPNNRFAAHLHFELRKRDLPANAWPRTNGEAWAKEQVRDYWLNPTLFIKQNRPQ